MRRENWSDGRHRGRFFALPRTWKRPNNAENYRIPLFFLGGPEVDDDHLPFCYRNSRIPVIMTSMEIRDSRTFETGVNQIRGTSIYLAKNFLG